jgi:hypothetical protein
MLAIRALPADYLAKESDDGTMDAQLPQTDQARTLYRRALDTSQSAMASVRRGEASAATASDIMRAARQGLGSLLSWHRVYDEDASYAELLRRAENLAAAVSTPARVLAPVELVTRKDALDNTDSELVHSAAYTLRNLLELVAGHLPSEVAGVDASSELPT